MGAIPPGGGSTTSFTNTPQAKDDCYTYAEDWLRDSSLYNVLTKIVTLDVMSNDLGGNAKALFSIDDGNGNVLASDTQLLTKDVNAAGCSPWEKTPDGNWIRINNDKIEFKLGNPAYPDDHTKALDLNSLGADDCINDEFVYAIRLGNGTLSQATVRIHIAGQNDKATIVAASGGDYAVAEAGGTANALAGDPNAHGTLVITDPDAGESSFLTPSAESLQGHYGSFTFDPATGAWTYALDNSLAATQGLNAGQAVTESLTVTSLDGGTTYTIVVNVAGANDAPVVQNVTVTTAVEDGPTVSGSFSGDDVDGDDSGSTLTYMITSDPAEGWVVNNHDGTFSFDPGDDFQDLADGETRIVTFTYRATDGHGAVSNSGTVSVTVTGTNDRPTLTITDASGALSEGDGGAALSDSGGLNVGDVDSTDIVTVSASYNGDIAWSAGDLDGDLADALVAGFGVDDNSWDYSASENLDFLAAGETITFSFDVIATDDSGASNNTSALQTVTITITGTNDAPVIEASAAGYDDTGAATEKAEPTEGGTLGDSGSLTFSDVDASDTHTASFAAAAEGYLGTFNLVDSDPAAAGIQTAAGSIGWSFSVDDSALDFLGEGEELEQTYTVTIDDGHGGTAQQTVTITITGTNDAPEIAATIEAGAVDEDTNVALDGTLSDSGSFAFTDLDLSDEHTVSVVEDGSGYLGTLTADISDASTGDGAGEVSWSFSVDNDDLQHLGADDEITQTYTVEVDDGHGGTVTQAVTITITGTNDAPKILIETGDSAAEGRNETDAGLSVSGTLTITDIDTSDVVDSVVTGVAVSGTGGAGSLTDDDFDAMFSLTGGDNDNEADGTAGSLGWSFNSGSEAFDYLGKGETLILTYTLTASDGHAGSDTQTVTITITGTNDQPTLTIDEASGDMHEGDGAATLSDSGSWDSDDVDATDLVTITATYNGDIDWSGGDLDSDLADALVDGFSYDQDGWAYSASEDLDFLAEGETITLTFDVVASDDSGASNDTTATQTVTITITGTNDAPTVTAEIADDSTNEDALYYYDASANFADVDHGDSLTYSATLEGGDPLPAWLAIDEETGEFSGMPENGDVGSYTVVVTATDEDGDSASSTFELTVDNVNDAPVVTSEISDDSTDEDVAYSYFASAHFADDDTIHGDTLSYSAELDNGDPLPSWLSINAETGELSGTPDNGDVGAYTIVVTATDDAGETAESEFELRVDNVNDVPVVTTGIADDSTDEDAIYSYDASANFADDDAIHGDTLTYSATLESGDPLPDWLSIDEETGELTGTPENGDVGSYTITVIATDDAGETAESEFKLTVDNINDAPVVATEIADQSTDEDVAYSYDASAHFADDDIIHGDSLAYSAALEGGDPLPSWLSIDEETGELSGTPENADVGVYTIAVTVTDEDGASASDTFELTVNNVNDAPTATNLSAAETYTEDTPRNLTDIVVADIDNATVTVTLILSNVAAGALSTGTSGAVTSTYNPATGMWSASGAIANVNALLAGVMFNPAPNFNGNFTIATSVSDGIAAPVTGSKAFTGIPVNDAPTATNLNASETYTEDMIHNLTDILVADVDSTTVTVTLTLSNVAAGALSTGTSGAVTSTYNPATGVWSASGAIADVNALLAGVVFDPALNFNGNFTVATSVSDGVAPPVTGTKSFTGTAVNDAPTATNMSAAETYTEDMPRNLTDIVVMDVDSDVTVTLTLSNPAAGTLSTGTSGGATSTYNSGTGMWQVSGSAADVNALLAGVTFTPALNFNDNFSIATSVSDGIAAPVTGSKAFTGIPVNDAPTAINLSAAETYTEDTALNLVDIVVADVDNATLAVTLQLSNAAAGALSTATSGAVTSTYNPATGVWSASGATANVNALLAGLTFTPALNFNGNFTITTSVSDGIAPPVTGSKAMTGTAVNDAPTATNMSAAETYTEDTPRNLTDIVVADVDSPNVTVTLTLSNVAAGVLSTGSSGAVTSTYNAVTGVWSASGAISDVNTLLAGVTFNPAPNFNNNFTIATSVSDGIAPPVTGSKAFTGTPVNDAPTATNMSAAETYTEDTPKNLTDIVVADVDSATVTVTLILSNAAAGALSTATSGAVTSTYDAVTGVWSASGATAEVNALLASLTFNPAANFNGDFTVATSVSDGVAAPVTGGKAFTGIPVNDAPIANPDTGSAGENETKSFNVLANDTDVDVGDTKSLVSIGTITVNGVAATASQAAAFSIIGGEIQFNPGTAFDSLNTGQNANVVVNYTTQDGSAVQSNSTLSLTVVGENEVATFTADNLRFLINTTTENEGGGGSGGQTIFSGANLGTFQALGLSGSWTFTLLGSSGSVPFQIIGNQLFTTAELQNSSHTLQIQASDGTSNIAIPVTVTVGTNGTNTITLGTGTDLGFGVGGNDTITGGDGNDSLSGGSNNDTLNGEAGSDVLWGASGTDNLNGGAGADLLTGGADADKFIYTATSDSGPTAFDTIADFQESVTDEQINLSAIDAVAGGADNAFNFIAGQTSAVQANSITWQVSGGNTIIRMDTTGDTTADMVITLLGSHTLTSNDFVL